jgi:hypothetical protein
MGVTPLFGEAQEFFMAPSLILFDPLTQSEWRDPARFRWP